MQSVCINFQVHQPFQYRVYRFFDIGEDSHYANDFQNKYLVGRSARRCYTHANNLLLSMIEKYGGQFKVSFTISGISLDLLEQYDPEVIEGFKDLARTGNVEFLGTPYYHSFASIKSKSEFIEQTLMHKKRTEEVFNVTPETFSNTELIYSDEIGEIIHEMGFKAILTEGAKHVLGWKSPNFVYRNALKPNMKILLRNFQLSDDVAFRFSNINWAEYPLTAEKFVSWMNTALGEQDCINLCIDYRVLGEWQDKETGIFEFIQYLPEVISEQTNIKFLTPTELANKGEAKAPVYVPYPISWAGEEKDLSIWQGNDLQRDVLRKLYDMEESVKSTQNPKLISQWRNLQNVDNFYWMNTKHPFAQGMHNPYNSPFEAFINYMNILSDLDLQVKKSTVISDIPDADLIQSEEPLDIRSLL